MWAHQKSAGNTCIWIMWTLRMKTGAFFCEITIFLLSNVLMLLSSLVIKTCSCVCFPEVWKGFCAGAGQRPPCPQLEEHRFCPLTSDHSRAWLLFRAGIILSKEMNLFFFFIVFTEIRKSKVSFIFAWKITLHSELYWEEKNRGGYFFLHNLIYPKIFVFRTIVRGK